MAIILVAFSIVASVLMIFFKKRAQPTLRPLPIEKFPDEILLEILSYTLKTSGIISRASKLSMSALDTTFSLLV